MLLPYTFLPQYTNSFKGLIQKLRENNIDSTIQFFGLDENAIINQLKASGASDPGELNKLLEIIKSNNSKNYNLYLNGFSEKTAKRIIEKQFGNPYSLALIYYALNPKQRESCINSQFKFFLRKNASSNFEKRLASVLKKMDPKEYKVDIPWRNAGLKGLSNESVNLLLRKKY